MEFQLLNEVEQSKKICPKHNTPFYEFKGQSFCPLCQKEQMEAKEQARAKEQFKKYHLRKTVEALEKDSILGDESLRKANFKNYIPTNEETEKALYNARHIAGEYLKADYNFNTILTGNPGTGKSHLAMSILKAVNENSKPFRSCVFISVNDLFRLIKDAISKPDSKYSELNMVTLLKEADLLVLDDLGSESSFKRETTESSEYNQKILFGILNARNRTIITTNLSSDELDAIYNIKITSRLYKGVEGHVIKFTEATEDKRSKIKF